MLLLNVLHNCIYLVLKNKVEHMIEKSKFCVITTRFLLVESKWLQIKFRLSVI